MLRDSSIVFISTNTLKEERKKILIKVSAAGEKKPATNYLTLS